MAQYTITIKTLMDNNFDFGMRSYPIFDEHYRDTLNYNILNHYYEEEIGLETPALFRKYLNDRLQLIMPKYNAMYNSIQEILANPLSNMNLKENFTASGTSEDTSVGENSSTNSSTNKNLYQDTPQGKINVSALDTEETYATNYTIDKNNNTLNGTTSGKNTGKTTNDYVKIIIGNSGNKYNIDLMNKITSDLKSIDQMIIDELSDLFMGIF